MKIGILTLPLHINYGGILQAYALQTVLLKLGHDVVIINVEDRIRDGNLFKTKLRYFICKIKNKLCGKNERNHTLGVQSFIQKEIRQSYYHFFSEIKESDFDAIVVGSDQIWRRLFVPHIEDSFLEFAQKWQIIRVAYAVSFGTDQWDYTTLQTRKCKKLLELFKSVSLRETSGIKLCEENLKRKVIQVLDPTLLLESCDYDRFVSENSYTGAKKRVFAYLIANTLQERDVISSMSKMDNVELTSVVLPDLRENQEPSVEKWLSYIKYADCVYTDSFHCAVFSILFHRKFLIVDASNGSTRIYNLLSMFKISPDHIVPSNLSVRETISRLMKIGLVDDGVYKNIEAWKQRSLAFLSSSFSS